MALCGTMISVGVEEMEIFFLFCKTIALEEELHVECITMGKTFHEDTLKQKSFFAAFLVTANLRAFRLRSMGNIASG